MNNTIPIRNIYYLLAYAWDEVDIVETTTLSEEKIPNLQSLIGSALISSTRETLKKGASRSYNKHEIFGRFGKGRIDLDKSISTGSYFNKKLYNNIETLSNDNIYNQIIKYCLKLIIRVEGLSLGVKEQAHILLRHFESVSDPKITLNNFRGLIFNRQIRHYKLPINICRIIILNTFVDSSKGEISFFNFIKDEKQMPYIFEAFVRNFMKREQSKYTVKREIIPWDLSPASNDGVFFLPKMETDISLLCSNHKIIIDTKFYKNTFQTRSDFQSKKIHSGNLYQLMSYVNNSYANSNLLKHWGILLYPTVGEEVSIDFIKGDNKISVKTINLAMSWTEIRADLLKISTEFS